ncbi:MAG: 2-hydroxyacyl-CoA dehydratase family protein [Oscillospiraceae bacterium]
METQRTLKEEYGTLGHFLRGDNDCHYLGDLYIEGTNLPPPRVARREGHGLCSSPAGCRPGARWLGPIGRDPVRMIRAFWKYRWLSAYLATPMMVDKWIEGDRGTYLLRATLTAIDCMVSDSITTLWREIAPTAARREQVPSARSPLTTRCRSTSSTASRLLRHQHPAARGVHGADSEQEPRLILRRPGRQLRHPGRHARCRSWRPASPSRASTRHRQLLAHDQQPLRREHDGQRRHVPRARERRQEGRAPVHDPLMYDDPTCKELGVHEVYDAIHFLEEQFHQPFNWDTFIQHIENTNQFNREETERWDVYAKTNNGALNPVCQGLFRIYFYQQGGNEYFLKASRKITRIFDKCVRRNIDTFPHTRHRAIAWSCGSTYYAHGVQWLYNCWGILCLINMDSLTGHNIVDTEDRDVMMSDVADWHARTPMRTHTVGGNRHIMQMWETAEKFNCDMIIMYDDIGCKGMAGAQGLIEEEIRKHDERFHTVWMPHSLMDHRIVSPAEARRTVNEYMINVMHEEPVDPSLLDFDDSMGW